MPRKAIDTQIAILEPVVREGIASPQAVLLVYCYVAG
jgi:hypothetical protein